MAPQQSPPLFIRHPFFIAALSRNDSGNMVLQVTPIANREALFRLVTPQPVLWFVNANDEGFVDFVFEIAAHW